MREHQFSLNQRLKSLKTKRSNLRLTWRRDGLGGWVRGGTPAELAEAERLDREILAAEGQARLHAGLKGGVVA